MKKLLRRIMAGSVALVFAFGATGCTSQVTPAVEAAAATADSTLTDDEIEARIQDAVDKAVAEATADCCEDGDSKGEASDTEDAAEADTDSAAEIADTDNINAQNAALASLSKDELEERFALEEGGKRTLHISYDGGLCPSPIPIAQLKGFFADEGLDTELVAVENQRDALAAGKIDTALGMLTDWLPSIQNGVDLRFSIALHTGCTSAAVLPDSGITKFEKGQRVGVVGAIGGVYHNIALRFIAHDGFKADDFTWLSLDAGTILKALQEDQVDVIVASDQLITQWEDDGLVSTIRSQTFDDDFKDEACCAIGFPGEFVEENPVTVLKITKAIYNAALWIQESDDNRKEAAELLLDGGYISGDVNYNARLLGTLKYGLDNKDLEKSLSDIVDEFVELEILRPDTDTQAFKDQILIKYDLNLLKE